METDILIQIGLILAIIILFYLNRNKEEIAVAKAAEEYDASKAEQD